MTKENKKQMIISYVIFAINGMLALSIGSLLPFIRDAKGLDYAFCGLLVSLHSIGNLFSSFASGILPISRKKSILFFNCFFAFAFFLIIFTSNQFAMALAFIMTGLARGASSNYNNAVMNEIAPGNAKMLNGLHAMFSIGAFLFPLILTLITSSSASNWIIVCYFMLGLGCLNWLLYAITPDTIKTKQKSDNKDHSYSFFKEPLFILCTATMFFYLCAEQGVIGWMITYFKDTGLLNATLSQMMASIQWIMILAGRLSAAWLSTKMKKENLLLSMGIGFVFFFFVLLISRTPLLIVLGIMGFGFSMAGIYPTTVSFAGKINQKYKLSWSYMLTIASFGSILMPSIIGKIAETAGIVYGMSSIIIVVILDLLLIYTLTRYTKKYEK